MNAVAPHAQNALAHILAADYRPRLLYLDTHRQMPGDYMCPRLVRLTLNDAFKEIADLVRECYKLDSRCQNLLYVVYQLQLSNGTEAATWFLRLDRKTQCFLMFALDIYGLELVARKV